MSKNRGTTRIYSHLVDYYFELAGTFARINHVTVLIPHVGGRKPYYVGLRTGIRDAVAAGNAGNSRPQPSGPA